MADSLDEWDARQDEMENTILTEPEKYFERGYTIGEYCLINAYMMIKQNPLCFAKAWSPYIITSNKDKGNIRLLKINLDTFLKCNNLGEAIIFKIIDAYPFILEEDDSICRLPNVMVERYQNYKARITAFKASDFALSLPMELVNCIVMMC